MKLDGRTFEGVVRGARLDGTLTMLRDGSAVGEKWVLAGEPAPAGQVQAGCA